MNSRFLRRICIVLCHGFGGLALVAAAPATPFPGAGPFACGAGAEQAKCAADQAAARRRLRMAWDASISTEALRGQMAALIKANTGAEGVNWQAVAGQYFATLKTAALDVPPPRDMPTPMGTSRPIPGQHRVTTCTTETSSFYWRGSGRSRTRTVCTSY